MPFKHYAALVIWDNALPEGWELNDEHTNWPTNPVLDGLPYRLESKRYNDAVYILDIEALKKTNQMTEQAIGLLEDDLVNAKVESKMLHEHLELAAAVEDVIENLFDPSETKLAGVFTIDICDGTIFSGGTIQDLRKHLVREREVIAAFSFAPHNVKVTVFPRTFEKYKTLLVEGAQIHAVIAKDTSKHLTGHYYLISATLPPKG